MSQDYPLCEIFADLFPGSRIAGAITGAIEGIQHAFNKRAHYDPMPLRTFYETAKASANKHCHALTDRQRAAFVTRLTVASQTNRLGLFIHDRLYSPS